MRPSVGGAVLSDVVVLILPDASLAIRVDPRSDAAPYQINAILGFPVFQALGVVTFTRDGRFLAGSTLPATAPASRIFMDGLAPLVECEVHGKPRLFAFDTGADSSMLFVPCYREFKDDLVGVSPSKTISAGAGGARTRTSYRLDEARLGVAGTEVQLHHVPVFPEPSGTSLDHAYGNLGRDLVAGFESFTMDFATFHFSLGPRSSRPRD